MTGLRELVQLSMQSSVLTYVKTTDWLEDANTTCLYDQVPQTSG